MKKVSGKAPGMLGLVFKGVGAGALCTLVCAAAVAGMINREWIQMETSGYAAMGILALSTWFSAGIPASGAPMDKPWAAIAGAAGYTGVLVAANALFLGGKYPGLGTALLIITMVTIGVLLGKGKGRGTNNRRRYKLPRT